MGVADRVLRPRVLGVVFGSYVAGVLIVALYFADHLSSAWYNPDVSRWTYTAYLLAATGFLIGSALLAFRLDQSFAKRIREINRELGSVLWDGMSALALGNPAATADREELLVAAKGRSHDEILETLGEAQTESVFREGEAPEAGLVMDAMQREMIRRREAVRKQRRLLAGFLPGPLVLACIVLGISAAMLPAVEGMLETYFELNTALILGLAYSWIGIAAYFVAALVAVIRQAPGEIAARHARSTGKASPAKRSAKTP